MIFISFNILRKLTQKQTKPIKVWQRSSLIMSNMLNTVFSIHNGKIFINIFINDKLIGRKFGELALTRKFPKHPIKDKKLNLKKKK